MKWKFSIGLICLISGISFMVYSFLIEPKTQRIIRPSSFENIADLGFFMHRQLIPRLSDRGVWYFVLQNPEVEKSIIQTFLDYGSREDERKYQIVETGISSTGFNYKKVSEIPAKDILDEDITYLVFIDLNMYFEGYQINVDTSSYYNHYYFLAQPIYNLEANYECVDWRSAFILNTIGHIDCFKNQVLRQAKKSKRVKEGQSMGAFEEIRFRHFIYYYYLFRGA